MVANNEGAEKRKRSRSPSYPGIGLAEALDRARVVWDEEKKHAASVETILAHWGYAPKSGQGLTAIAALKKFGLIEDDGAGGARRARLSESAQRIILDGREDSTERDELIREAALKPSIHRELWQEFEQEGSVPSDSNFAHKLRFERNFTDRAIREFIPQFKATLQFAKLVGTSGTLDSGIDKSSREGESNMDNAGANTFASSQDPPPSVNKTMQIPIALAPNEYAFIQAAFPLSEDKWTQMLAVLEAMKPGLISKEIELPKQEPLTSSKEQI